VPFFDIAKCVDPGVRADQRIVDDVIAKVTPGNRAVPRILPFILNWAALRATPGFEMPPGLADPFDPLIQLFERGGGFHTENGEVNLEWVAVRMAGWRDRAGDPPMTTGSLDEIDRAGSLAQFGHTGEDSG
jgi:hypothetical protein